ncbi:MAG: SLC13 family permease [Promethearchaeota archaeon]
MSNYISILIVTLMFITVMVVFSTEKIDYLTIAIFAALVSAWVLKITYIPSSSGEEINFETFVKMIEFKPLIFIFGMQIVIAVAEKHKIFHYVAVQAVQLTKGNERALFYLMTIVATFTASVVADVTVSIIFAPLLIRTCRILDIEPAPFLFGMTISINIGSLMTPFSSSENIIIASHFEAFGVDAKWFIVNVMIFGILLMLLTIFLLDKFMLQKNPPVKPERKELVQEILVASVILEDQDKKSFIANSIFLVIIFSAFFIIEEAYLVAIIGAIIIVLINGEKIEDYFKNVEWNVIFFFASLYIIIGVMILNGTIEIINDFLLRILPDNLLFISLFILIMSSLFSGFLANSPTALMFLAIIDGLIESIPSLGANPNPLIIALLIGINLGGNFLPQGAACDVMTLTIATKNKVKGFNFKTLTKNGAVFALIHTIMGAFYLLLYIFLTT